VVEVQDTSTRENYSKVVIHKRKCVPYLALPSNGRLISPEGKNNRPIVPPKPVFREPDIPRYQRYRVVEVETPPPPSFNNKKGSIITEAKEELIKNICNSREKTLRAESQELLGRMRKKVELLKEDKVDIQTELTDNTTNIITIIETVRSLGNIVDADKLKIHTEELDSITSLMTVLRVRLKSNQNKAELTRDSREKDIIDRKISKLLSQLEEAQNLKSFRDRRGEIIFNSLSSYLCEEKLLALRRELEVKVSLRSELCEVEEQIQLAEYQISALQNTKYQTQPD